MKRIIPCLLVALTVVVASCKKESYFHQFTVLQPVNSHAIVYADQENYTIYVASTDPFEATSQNAWMTIAEGNKKYSLNYSYGGIYDSIPVALTFTPNKADTTRRNLIRLTASGGNDWSYSSGVQVSQVHWLNITTPSTTYNNNLTTSIAGRIYTSSANSDKIAFTVYGDWTLSVPHDSFIHLTAPADTSGTAGSHSLAFSINENTAAKDTLKTKLILTSKGISTPIYYYQLPADATSN